MLGAMAAPAVVKAENLMKIIVPKQEGIIVLSSRPMLLAGDYDGDVMLTNLYDIENFSKQMAAFRERINKNGIFGAEVPEHLFTRSPYLDVPPERSRPAQVQEKYEPISRTLITPRHGERVTGNSLDLKITIQKIRPKLVRL
jgi:hypothetical protein